MCFFNMLIILNPCPIEHGSEIPTLNVALKEYADIFQESEVNFQNAACFAINVLNALTVT